MKSISFFCHSRVFLSGILLVLSTCALFAQSSTIKLPTADSSSNFCVQSSSGSNLLRLNGDAGFYFGGATMTGVIPATGTGTRLMWFPGKSAFRVGTVNGTLWDDMNIGLFSVAIGRNAAARGESSMAMGEGTTANGSYSTAIGHSTTASGEYGSTAIGNNATTNGSYSIAIGNSTITNSDASFSTAMGNYVKVKHNGSFMIGDNSKTTYDSSSSNNQMTMRFAGGYRLYSNSVCTTGVALSAGSNSWASVSDARKKENYTKANREYFLNSLAQLKLGSWNYIGQDAKTFRHYGPMAQEIFKYFGKDEYGIIGNDTTLASADMDGIMMICLQALEERTSELQKANEKITVMEKQNIERDKIISVLTEKIDNLAHLLSSSTTLNKSQYTTHITKE
jgi:hypothetical protein